MFYPPSPASLSSQTYSLNNLGDASDFEDARQSSLTPQDSTEPNSIGMPAYDGLLPNSSPNVDIMSQMHSKMGIDGYTSDDSFSSQLNYRARIAQAQSIHAMRQKLAQATQPVILDDFMPLNRAENEFTMLRDEQNTKTSQYTAGNEMALKTMYANYGKMSSQNYDRLNFMSRSSGSLGGQQILSSQKLQGVGNDQLFPLSLENDLSVLQNMAPQLSIPSSLSDSSADSPFSTTQPPIDANLYEELLENTSSSVPNAHYTELRTTGDSPYSPAQSSPAMSNYAPTAPMTSYEPFQLNLDVLYDM